MRQKELPGFEPRESDLAKRLAAAPLKPALPQEPLDFGLFGDDHRQIDLVDRAMNAIEKGRRYAR